jgi:uncharacterized protein YaiE (UPF0345 family)
MLKHNSYFDDAVQSIGFVRNGLRATVGVMLPQVFRFATDAAERMTVVSGALRANVAEAGWMTYPAGTYFEVPARSAFEVEAVDGPAAYLCEFLG